MGLDMYLYARRHLWDHMPEEKATLECLNAVDMQQGHMKVDMIQCEAIYWRKSNQIHLWFVQNVQDGNDDCKEYYVSRDKLETLLSKCVAVLADPDAAPDILPTHSGFFFGSTDYNKYYFRELERTKKEISALLALPHLDKWNFYYHSSW